MVDDKIYIAGHRGMVGSAIVRALEAQGEKSIIVRTHSELDLTDQAAVRRFFHEERPSQVYLAAAKVGGIYANNQFPADFIYNNLMIEANVIHEAWASGVKRLLFLGSSCIYPKLAPQPMSEDALLTGQLEPTNEPYAIAKLYAYWITVNYREAYGIYACNGILFNHESPRRGETFVTRKITRGLANIAQGLDTCLYMGNLDALRDWGHAKDYVRMQWMMLQQDAPKDYVIATGVQFSVREFIQWTANALGIALRFEKSGVEEYAVVLSINGDNAPGIKVGDIIVRVDPRYFRPTEVETLLGDASRARTELGWEPEITAQQMCAEMVISDLQDAKKNALLARHGYDISIERE